jgi:hypothetical protein
LKFQPRDIPYTLSAKTSCEKGNRFKNKAEILKLKAETGVDQLCFLSAFSF